MFIQVSVGTLFAFTTAAVSVLILRYVPPDEVPLSSSLQEAIKSVSSRLSCNIQESDSKNLQNSAGSSENESHNLHEIGEALLGCPPIEKSISQGNTSLLDLKSGKTSIALELHKLMMLCSRRG